MFEIDYFLEGLVEGVLITVMQTNSFSSVLEVKTKARWVLEKHTWHKDIIDDWLERETDFIKAVLEERLER